MASFVHLADAKSAARIVKSGLRAGRRGVFAMPVTRDFSVTHQWSRELRRRGVRTFVCVQFRIADDEPVTVGVYNGEKTSMTAAEAVACAASHTAATGLEVIIPRRIAPAEIARVYPAPRVTGWRFSPAAKGRKPCPCSYCNRGEIRGRRLIVE